VGEYRLNMMCIQITMYSNATTYMSFTICNKNNMFLVHIFILSYVSNIITILKTVHIFIPNHIKVDKVEIFSQLKINPTQHRNQMSHDIEGVNPNRHFPAISLKNEYKIFHNLCGHSLLPRSGGKYRVTDTAIMVLSHLSHGKRVNLPYLIIQHMIGVIQAKQGIGDLPYSMVLTKIFIDFKILFIGEESRRNHNPFTRKNVSHIRTNDFPDSLGLEDVSVAPPDFLKEEEEENPLNNIVNVIIVDNHKNSQQTAPKTSHFSSKIYATTFPLDLNLSHDFSNKIAPISPIPVYNVDNSDLFGSECLNRFINTPQKSINLTGLFTTPPSSELPHIPSIFSSFGSFKSTGTSAKNQLPAEPENPPITNRMIYEMLSSLQEEVINLQECFVVFVYSFFGATDPTADSHGSSSKLSIGSSHLTIALMDPFATLFDVPKGGEVLPLN